MHGMPSPWAGSGLAVRGQIRAANAEPETRSEGIAGMRGNQTLRASLTLLALLALGRAESPADNWLRSSEVVPHVHARTRAAHYQPDGEPDLPTADSNGNGGANGTTGDGDTEEVLPAPDGPRRFADDPVQLVAGDSAFPYDIDYWLEVNVADEGLGYEGSFFTVGGLFPYAHDDLGGMWFVEARAHVSEHGNFFSNVGWGRRQFINPATSMALSVWYDFDGDEASNFGHAFHQLGLSGDVQSDWWKARINGYIPVDKRDFVQQGFTGNFILLQDGIDSALDGIEGEFGFRVPTFAGRTGWAYFGGYAYQSDNVDGFSGFLARLELPSVTESVLLQLQLNHDERFDTTGFANLIFRFGSARGPSNDPIPAMAPRLRRTERNAHIARFHQDPIIATNPANGNQPWRIFFADNTSGSDGTFEDPFGNLAAAVAAADQPHDIIFVREGDGTTMNYDTQVTLLPNQRLLGDGVAHFIDTQGGPLQLATDVDGIRPMITNSSGPAVVLASGSLVSGLDIENPQTAILGDMRVAAGTTATVDRVNINNGNVGVDVADSTGAFAFTETNITTTFDDAFRVKGGAPDVDYQGNINNASNESIDVSETTGGTVAFRGGIINDNGGTGVRVRDAAGDVDVQSDLNLFNSPTTGISVQNSSGNYTFADALIFEPASRGVELLDNNQSTTRFNNLRVINNNAGTQAGLAIINNSAIAGRTDTLIIDDGFITNQQGQAIEARGTTVNQPILDIQLQTVTSLNSTVDGVMLSRVQGSFGVVGGTTVQNATASGIAVESSNLDVDLNTVTLSNSNAGVLLEDNEGSFTLSGGGGSSITGVQDGIVVRNSAARITDIDNISAARDGVSASSTDNSTTNVLFDRLTVTAAGRDAIRLRESTMSGALNATITNSSLTATMDGVNAATDGLGGTLRLNLGFPPPEDDQGNDTNTQYVIENMAGSTFELGGNLGQGMTFNNSDNGNIANNGNTTGGGPPTVMATGDIDIVDPDTIPVPPN